MSFETAILVDRGLLSRARAELGADFVRILDYFKEDGIKSLAAIEDAVRAGNAAAMVMPAHTLKGEARQFGAGALSDLAVLAFSIGMAVYGWQLMARTWGSSLPVIGLPGGFGYMPLFAGGVLMTLFVLEHLLIRLSGRKVEAAPDAQDILMTEA